MVRVSSTRLLEIELCLGRDRQLQFHSKRLAGVMRKLGWEGPSAIKMRDGSAVRGYQRPLSDWDEPDDPSLRITPLVRDR
jgi:hypothetical protein